MLQGALRKLLGIGETVGKAAVGAAPMGGVAAGLRKASQTSGVRQAGMAGGAGAAMGLRGRKIGGAGRMIPQAKKAFPMLPNNGQYAQYMNADGTGGGFGPNNPSQLQVQPNYGMQRTQPSAQLHNLSPGVEMTPNEMLDNRYRQIRF